MRRLVVMLAAISLSVAASAVKADTLAIHEPVNDIGPTWASSAAAGGKASGYNNGSSTQPGKHWAQADDFVLLGTSLDVYQITSLSFIGGTELDGEVDSYRISVYEDDTGLPTSWPSPLFRYEEQQGALNRISASHTDVDGPYYRWLYEVTLDTADLGLFLNGATTYYLSIEADVTNTTDMYEGYSTYYQRFYWLKLVDPNGSTDINDQRWLNCDERTGAGWAGWELGDDPSIPETDFIWRIEGTWIPEPATLLLVVFGGLGVFRRRASC